MTIKYSILIANILYKLQLLNDDKNKFLAYVSLFVFIGVLLLILSAGMYTCVMMFFGFIVAQGLVTSVGAEATILLLPSIAIFCIGWLIKRGFLETTGVCQYIVCVANCAQLMLLSIHAPDIMQGILIQQERLLWTNY